MSSQSKLNQLKVGDNVVILSLGIPQCVDVVKKLKKRLVITEHGRAFNLHDGTACEPSVFYKSSISADERDFRILELRHTIEDVERKLIAIKTSIYEGDVSNEYRGCVQEYFTELLQNLNDIQKNMAETASRS